MHGGHHLAVGVERLLADARHPGFKPFPAHAERRAHVEQRELGGVAHPRAVRGGGVVAEHKAGDELPVSAVVEPAYAAQHTVQPNLGDGHAVLGEGAGLVRADDADRAERLDRRQPPHDRVDLDHPLDAEREHDGHDGGQALGDRRHRQRDRSQQHFGDVAALEHRDAEHRQADDDRHDAQNLAEVGQPLLERGELLLLPGEHRRDPPDLGVHAGGGHDPLATPIGHARRGKGHIHPVADARLTPGHERGVLFGGHRFPGEGALLHLEVDRLEKAQVGGDHPPGLEQHNVARHEGGGGHLGEPAVPAHERVGARELFERLERLLRLGLLRHADDGV